MSSVLEPIAPPPARVPSRASIADLLRRLGDIPPERVRSEPPPGTATFADLDYVNEHLGPVCELIDGTLVEKAVGHYESWLGMIVGAKMFIYLEVNDIGMLYGEAAVLRILPNIGRAADVAFVSWSRLTGGRPPAREDRIPEVVPDLAVEVLSHNNTPAEMTRKRGEYFRAGVRQVWQIDPDTRTASVYTAADRSTLVPADGVLDGADILPGFTLPLADLFARADHVRGS